MSKTVYTNGFLFVQKLLNGIGMQNLLLCDTLLWREPERHVIDGRREAVNVARNCHPQFWHQSDVAANGCIQ
eukprot:5567276-Amphidinium_carterae.1